MDTAAARAQAEGNIARSGLGCLGVPSMHEQLFSSLFFGELVVLQLSLFLVGLTLEDLPVTIHGQDGTLKLKAGRRRVSHLRPLPSILLGSPHCLDDLAFSSTAG